MPTSIMQKNYSNCPLKKRPVIQIAREELLTETTVSDTELEPENLSTKPEDLSKTGNYPKVLKSESPIHHTRTPSPSPPPPRLTSPSPPPQLERRNTVSPVFPTPAYPAYYPNIISPKSEPLNLHSPPPPPNEPLSYVSPTNWHKPIIPTPTYPNYLAFPSYAHHIPYHHSEHGYSPIYHNQVSPTRSEPLSPYAQRESSVSPPNSAYMQKRESSLSPPMHQSYPSELRRSTNNNIIKSEHHYGSHHRYMPYQINSHHHHHHLMMPVDQSSLSPTSSHTSYNSLISSRRSMSPTSSSLSTAPSTPEDLSSSILMDKSNVQKVKKENCEKVNGAPRYQCSDCGKSYSTYSGLSKHQQFHCPAAIGNQAKKTFSCTDCDKVYVTLGGLKMHIKTHTRPCKCPTCGKNFSRRWLLQGHIRTHTGEKPFICQHCHRAFADRSNLRAHLQTHSTVKKYSCTSCSKTFSRMSLLTKHNDGGCPGLTLGAPIQSSTYGNHHVQNNDISVY